MASHYQGADADLRNLYRKGSGMTLRRLWVLIRGLPPNSPFSGAFTWLWADLEAVEKSSVADKLRERTAHYHPGG